jgi:hypothetical protein
MAVLLAAALIGGLVPGPGARLHEYGISLHLRPPWHGVLFGPHELGPRAAVELQLATFPFSRSRIRFMWDLGRPLRRSDLHVIVADYGRVRLRKRPATWSPRLPLKIRLSDVDGPFEGMQPNHAGASRVFLIGGHQIQLWVEFGTPHPGPPAISRANALLRRIDFAKRR